MQNLYKKTFSPAIIVVIILIAVGTGGYYFFSNPDGNEMRDESNEINGSTQPNEPVGFEENPATMPTVDVQSGNGAQVNPNIPVVTEQPIIGAEVSIKNFAFGPATVTIKAGQSVEWVNSDQVGHTVTSDAGLFDSGNLAKGNIYTHKFTKAGTYTYFCKPHPNMKGTIIVQ